MRLVVAIALVAAMGLSAPLAEAKRKKKQEVDFLALATIMLRDKHYDRAEQALLQVNLEDEDTDLGRFHLLYGLVRLHQGLYQDAGDAFEEAITNGFVEPLIYVHLGQARFGAKEWEASLAAFAKAEDKSRSIAGTFAMRAEAHHELGDNRSAWNMLDAGIETHPTFNPLLRRKVFLAVELGLFHTAADLGREYIRATGGTAEDQLAIGWSIIESGSIEEGLAFLETANLEGPGQRTVIMALARAYKQKEMPRTAAELLERLVLVGDGELAVEASELFRTAGLPLRALALNGRIADSKARLRQRLAILLDLQRYDMIASMERDLLRNGLLADDSIRYAVAYAWFEEGEYENAERLLTGVKDPELFRKAAEIRKAMQECRGERWKC